MPSPNRPVTTLDKDEILAGLFASWNAIDRLLAELPEISWHTPTPLPGWAVRDVVAHISGTESMLLGIPPHDPLTYGSVALLLTGVAFLSTIVPALRATRVDPMIALRAE